jgi:hypothetical protein
MKVIKKRILLRKLLKKKMWKRVITRKKSKMKENIMRETLIYSDIREFMELDKELEPIFTLPLTWKHPWQMEAQTLFYLWTVQVEVTQLILVCMDKVHQQGKVVLVEMVDKVICKWDITIRLA